MVTDCDGCDKSQPLTWWVSKNLGLQNFSMVSRNGLYLDLPQLGAADGRGFQLQQCLRGLGARAWVLSLTLRHTLPPFTSVQRGVWIWRLLEIAERA